MKKIIKSATNTANTFAPIRGAQEADDLETIFSNRVKDVNDDFDYVVDGLGQLEINQALQMLDDISETLKTYIQQIASELS